MDLQTICNWIVLFGAVSLAIINIYNLIAKPSSFLKKKKEDEMTSSIKNALNELMPLYFQQENEKRKEDWDTLRQSILDDIKDYCDEKFELLFAADMRQDELIDLSKRQIVHLMGQKIEDIYNEYKHERRIPRYKKENMDDLYNLYSSAGGNGRIERIHNRVEEWEIID